MTDRQSFDWQGTSETSLRFPFSLQPRLTDCSSTRLAFAWSKSDSMPVILGQMNFFMEFDICFYRSQLEFEIKRNVQST